MPESQADAVTLRPVESLRITFLVDNSIEWLTELPPGFTHETPQHMREHAPHVDEVHGGPVLDFERFCCGAHGFAALIETQTAPTAPVHRTLFDTGPDARSLPRNLDAMRVDPASISRVVLSHWHADHTGGLLAFLRARAASASASPTSPAPAQHHKPEPEPCVVDAHPDRPAARGNAPPPAFDALLYALPRDPDFGEIARAGGVVEAWREAHVVAGGAVYVSGEIPRVTAFEGGLLTGQRFVEEEGGGGRWVREPHIMDERYAAVDVAGKGLVIFSACSHAGIANVLTHATRTLQRPIYMVVGGLHLAGRELAPRIAPTVDFLARAGPRYVLPMHCSGFAAKVALERAFGAACVPAGVGMRVEVKADEAG